MRVSVCMSRCKPALIEGKHSCLVEELARKCECVWSMVEKEQGEEREGGRGRDMGVWVYGDGIVECIG